MNNIDNMDNMAIINIKTQDNYDNYLATVKNGSYKRIEKFMGVSKNIQHECQDIECGRKWKIKPSSTLEDDYYCPSCVLHHRNNMGRFLQTRLLWTKSIPNTFYIFKIVDPLYPDIELIKFGRTQNKKSLKRYPKKELNNYKMELLLELRGQLITMTRIENYWKKKSKILNIYHMFSVENFHGKAECIKPCDHLNHLLNVTHKIYDENSDDPNNDGFEHDK